jgi:anion-transporting  ArsA/GET3 family ATPase
VTTTTDLRDLIEHRSVLVCCGTGGVGKTTTAAALAMAGAAAGRRAVVVTIDPAKRLADALGLASLGNDPSPIAGSWPGEMAAMMLDTKSTFDDLVRRNARSPEQAELILANPFYRNVSTTLSGTQDYMAVEKLFELHQSGSWDLVVVDTPPTRDALAFLEAPRLLARLLDNTIYRMVTAPGRGVIRAVNATAQTVLRQLARVVGVSVVDDAVEFFRAFEGMEEGFRSRAQNTIELLGDPETAFVLIATPRVDTLPEARYFVDRVAGAGLAVEAIVVNRVLPEISTSAPDALELADRLAAGPLAGAARALADIAVAKHEDAACIAELVAMAPDATVTKVPLLDEDVHDVRSLGAIADALSDASHPVEPD